MSAEEQRVVQVSPDNDPERYLSPTPMTEGSRVTGLQWTDTAKVNGMAGSPGGPNADVAAVASNRPNPMPLGAPIPPPAYGTGQTAAPEGFSPAPAPKLPETSAPGPRPLPGPVDWAGMFTTGPFHGPRDGEGLT